MAKSLQMTVARWKQGAAGAQAAYTEGIQSTQVDVMGKAIAAAPDAVRNFSDAITSGRWAAAINASGGTANWKAQSIKKAGNFGQGIAQAEDKFQRAMGKLLPALEGIVGALPARQPGNVGANVERVRALALALHARKGEFKG